MKISLINFTENAKELLIFTKNTRHLSSDVRFEEVLDLTDRQKNEQLEYVFGTIGSAWEFVDYVFLLQDVSRAFTHQLVRSRVGVSFAQQSLRLATVDEFSYFVPDKIEHDQHNLAVYDSTMSGIAEGYDFMLRHGVDPQDARGVLPTNICTNILMKINLRALSTLMETRLCIRAQGEFQEAAMIIRDIVSEVHPWALKVLSPCCILKSYCPWRNFTECPLKKKYKHLQPIASEIASNLLGDWKKLIENKHSPQPKKG